MTVKEKQRARRSDDGDVFKNLGRFIEGHFKKGIHKVEEVFKDNKNADDKLFAYFKAFLDDKGVASVTPSSKYIVERVLKAMDLRNARTIIEYGAANGVITRPVLSRLPADGRLLAIELNDLLFEQLRRELRDPRLIACHGDVREIGRIAGQHGIASADVIVSGVPFAFLSGRGRHELLAKTYELLRPGGRFVAYQVTTHLIHLLHEYFPRVRTQFEIRNLPPHFVFTAFK